MIKNLQFTEGYLGTFADLDLQKET